LTEIDRFLFQEIGLREGRPESIATGCYRQLGDFYFRFFAKDLTHIVDEYSAYHSRDELSDHIESEERNAAKWLAKSPCRYQVLHDWLAREFDVLLCREANAGVSSTIKKDEGRIVSFDLTESLDPNSKYLLQAMLELKVTEINRQTAEEIVRVALASGDAKRVFDQLKRLHLVNTKQGKSGGIWLTPKGIEIAKAIKKLEIPEND